MTGLEQPAPRRCLDEQLERWREVAHQCRELGNWVVLATATAATTDPVRVDAAAAERHRLLGELAVMLAVNTE
ncbi:hypothetical protein ACGFNU_47380 [Spirillospora sp. NPDC048911]|uniref:hypothetical protein n=1 Tax=Spirillospora sp. NPDC048911 TaxID=3364527 RepID=UPI00371CF2EB